MPSKTNDDELNVLAQQLFDKICISQKNINLLENYYEETKDYNTEYKSCRKNSSIDADTANYINFFTNYIKKICFEYKNIIFNINIYTKNYEDLSNHIYMIKMAIVCCLYDKKGFKDKVSLKIDLYLTGLEKTLPLVPGTPIKKQHAKSGYSIFSDNIYICIYRKEEWFKSLIQELFFAFTIDLEDDKINFRNILSNSFRIDDPFLIGNSIVEFCARLFNVAVFLYFDKNVKELDSFKKEFRKMTHKEQMFSVSQAHKILGHFGLKYQDILHKEQEINPETNHEKNQLQLSQEKYKDEGDLFCYYITTSLLFIHQTRMIQWFNFEQNNFFNIKKSERELVIFCHYIAHCSKDDITIKTFEKKEAKQSTESNISNNIRFCYHRI